jgi:hypothetical protein
VTDEGGEDVLAGLEAELPDPASGDVRRRSRFGRWRAEQEQWRQRRARRRCRTLLRASLCDDLVSGASLLVYAFAIGHELLEQRSIRDHSSAQVLGCGFSGGRLHIDVVPVAVVLHDVGMIDRDQVGL